MAAKTTSSKPEQTGTSRVQSRPRTPHQLDRQEKCFTLSIEGKSYRTIAAEMKIDMKTVMTDVAAEQQRRADELGARRETEKARAVATYENVIRRAVMKSEVMDRIADAAMADVEHAREQERRRVDNGERPPAYEEQRDFGFKCNDRTLDAILKARERIDKVLGVDAPTKVDLGLSALLEALDVPE